MCCHVSVQKFKNQTVKSKLVITDSAFYWVCFFYTNTLFFNIHIYVLYISEYVCLTGYRCLWCAALCILCLVCSVLFCHCAGFRFGSIREHTDTSTQLTHMQYSTSLSLYTTALQGWYCRAVHTDSVFGSIWWNSCSLAGVGVSGIGQVREVHGCVEDDGKLFRKQLVEANTIMSVHPVFTGPVIALRPTVNTRGETKFTNMFSG